MLWNQIWRLDRFFSNLTLTSNGIIKISFANKLVIIFSCVHLQFHEKYATKWFRKKKKLFYKASRLRSCKSFTKSVSYQITTPNRIFSTNKIVKNCLVWTFFSFGHKPVLVVLQNKRTIYFDWFHELLHVKCWIKVFPKNHSSLPWHSFREL